MILSNDSIEWEVDNPNKVVYAIWNAIYYSTRSRRKEYEEYSMLLNKYKIRIIDNNTIKAEIRSTEIIKPKNTKISNDK